MPPAHRADIPAIFLMGVMIIALMPSYSAYPFRSAFGGASDARDTSAIPAASPAVGGGFTISGL